MNSSNDFPTARQLSFIATPESPGELIFSLTLPGRLPSWNEILGMEQWARYKFKKDLANSFLYELRRFANDSSMKTTCARSTWLTYAVTLESYLETTRQRRALRSANKKLTQAALKKSASKSSGSVPF